MLRVRSRLLCAFLLVAAAAATAGAQEFRATVKGQVADTSQAALPGATVTVQNLDTNEVATATTNDQGTFEIKNLPPGNYVLEAWHEKYGTQTQNVTVAGSETKTVDFGFKG